MRWWIVAVGLGSWLIPASVARAAVTLEVSPGIDGNGFQHERYWCPIGVEARNSGAHLQGFLRLDHDDHLSHALVRPVDLPSVSQKRYFLYVPPGDNPMKFAVELVSGRRVLARSPKTLKLIASEDIVVAGVGVPEGSLGTISGTHTLIGGIRPPGPRQTAFGPGYHSVWPSVSRLGAQANFAVVYPRPELLPDQPVGYDGVDLLVLGAISARSLSPESQAAVRRWIASGGTAVIVGGAESDHLQHPFYRELLPVEVVGTRQLPNLNALGRAYQAAIDAMPAVVAEAKPKAGAEVLVRQSGLPLVVEGNFALGRVTFLAFDHAGLPVRAWQHQSEMWLRICARAWQDPPLVSRVGTWHGYQFDPVASAVVAMPAMRLPSFLSVAFFLLAYLILLVPVNYYLLKRYRRRELAWLTTPAIVAVFTVGAYGIGYGTKGGRILTNEIAVVEARAGGAIGASRTYVGVFSPKRANYRISFDDPYASVEEVSQGGERPSRALTMVQQEGMSLRDVRINMWAMRVFRVMGTTDLTQGVASSLLDKGASIEGSITNATDLDLSGCVLIRGTQSAPLGALKSGQTRRIRAKLTGGTPGGAPASPGYRPPPRPSEQDIKEAVYAALSPRGAALRAVAGEVLLVGWSHRTPGKVTVKPRAKREKGLACYLFHLPCPVDPASGIVRLGPGTIPQHEVGSNSKYGSSGPGWRGAGLGRGGYLIISFELPAEARKARPQELNVIMQRLESPQWRAPERVDIALYHWRARRWEKIALGRQGGAVTSPARYISRRRGEIRMRITGSAGSGVNLLPKIDLEFVGQRKGA